MRATFPRQFARNLFGRAARAGVMGTLVMLFCATCATQQAACSSARSECTSRVSVCPDESEQAACEAAYACEWRTGCVRPCAHQQDQQAGCVPECWGPQPGSPDSPESCATLEGCSWDPACFEDPLLPCDPGLDEVECRRRHCTWEQVSPGSTLG